jgi:rubrerythrin
MSNVQKNDMIALIDMFIENELLFSEYYSECARLFADKADNFEKLARHEKVHAAIFEKIKQSVIANPDKWSRGDFQINALKLVVEDVKEKVAQLKSGKLKKEFIISYAVDMERALIEKNFFKALKTGIKEFEVFFEKLQSETAGHQKLLEGLT